MPIITLTTDFGTRDGFVGAMKGVIARVCGTATVVDLAHDIPRHDIAHAAWVLHAACREFPVGTIHVAVVDPGVGTTRMPVIVASDGHIFVGPDNGLFAHVLSMSLYEAQRIAFPRFMARRVSPTFHGRDIFAHAAAVVARGDAVHLAGPTVRLTGTLPWGPRELGLGRIVHIDHFGNLVSDLPVHEAGEAIVVGERLLPIHETYADVEIGQLVAYVGSAGTIEIAVREGNAAERLKLERGTPVMPSTAATTGPYR